MLDGDYIVWVNDTDNVLSELSPSVDSDGGLDNVGVVDLDSAGASGSPVVNPDQDFGYAPPAYGVLDGLIGDTVFFDGNGNGAPDGGEGIEGVLIELLNASGTQVFATAVTNERGVYSFGNIDTGAAYLVRVDTSTLPPGLTNSVDPDGGTASQSSVDLGAAGGDGVNDSDGVDNGVNRGQDFGYVASGTAGSIGNLVWTDTNADGTFDVGESGIDGVSVDLYADTNGNGELDPDEPLIASTVTAGGGIYGFSNLPTADAGNGSGGSDYIVKVSDREQVLAGYWHSRGGADTDGESQADPYAVTLTTASPNLVSADFGYYLAAGSIGDLVWQDDGSGGGTANDGIRQTGEPGIADVEVTLTISYPNGSVVLKTTTDANGNYEFGNLLLDEDFDGQGAGGPTYSLVVATPAGQVSTHSAATDGAEADGQADNPAGEPATPVQGGADNTNDFGFAPPQGTVNGHLYADTNGNGTQDAGEPDLAGVDLIITDSASNTRTVTTDANGDWSATVPPGFTTADVDETDPDYPTGYVQTEGTDPTYLTAVAASTVSAGNDGYYAPPGDISGNVWLDEDGDGVQDVNEPGEGAVTVDLVARSTVVIGGVTYDANDVIATVVTDANGDYRFDGLPAGDYSVDATDTANELDGLQTAPGTTDPSGVIRLSLGESAEVDFGYVPSSGTAVIGDFVWSDADGDGVQDAGEVGLGGVTLQLLDGSGTPVDHGHRRRRQLSLHRRRGGRLRRIGASYQLRRG